MNNDNFDEEYLRKVVSNCLKSEAENTCISKNYRIIPSKTINEILLNTVVKSKQLLEEKGFPNTLNARVEKHVLLGTEVSELADAVKKGKGEVEEGEELADIVIRLCNFLCADETFNQYVKLSEVFWKYEAEFPNAINIEIYDSKKHGLSMVEAKYVIIQQMMICNENVRVNADNFVRVGIHNADPVPLINLWYACLKMAALCDAYAETFLPETLQFYIHAKMDKNFKRPYRYNTCDEFNK